MSARRPPAAPKADASFRALMRAEGVTPLPPRDHVELQAPKSPRLRFSPEDSPCAPENDHDMGMENAETTENAPEQHRRADQSPRVLSDLRRGRWPAQAEIDLHGLTRDEALSALRDFLAGCVARGLRCVRVIHGKGHASPGGRAILKPMTRQWLARRPEVLAFCAAPPRDGGDGALLALLCKGNATPRLDGFYVGCRGETSKR
ncbi:MAG: Smr/MutS family protein [Zoogloeaceae bacterium]|jgi:DNA-nicking Smr family endonuclease|nr:Smr/MutS family protein [Zoogloeaceae bacterium]